MIANIKILVELFAYLYCLAELFGKKFKISIHVVVFIIFDLFLRVGINDYGFPEYLSSLGYIAMLLYGLLYYSESIKVTLVNCFLAMAIVTIFQLLMFLPLYYSFFVKYKQREMYEMLIMIGCFFLIMMCSYKFELKRLSDFCVKRNKLIVGVSVLALFGFVINFYQIIKEGKIASEISIQMVYFFLIFSFTIYEWQKTRMDVEKKRTQLEMNKLYYNAYDQLVMLVRERQHDMKSHINAILSMIYMTDNYNDLVMKQKEYCGYVMEQSEKTRLVLSARNPLIAGFLYSKIQEAESKGIEVEYQIAIKKENTIIPEYELVEMLGILIDNAIEALIDTDQEEQLKKIYLSIKEAEDYIELIVANVSTYYEEALTERFFETGYSNKGKERGIGLAKLKRMVHDNKGNIVVSNEKHEKGNFLTFSINIPIS